MPTQFVRLNRTARLISAFVLTLSLNQIGFSQTLQTPEREQLLNGLRILYWPIPGSPTVAVKLRINSGAAFDLAGKAGEMALLGDLLFPDPATVDYFNDEMGGRLEVKVNYDSITITMLGKASELENIIEVLRNALLATQLNPEVVRRVREAHIKTLRQIEVSPAMVADRAVVGRLYGDFPYGRPSQGSPEDLSRVDWPDLMLARDRFLNSNNATLAIVGGVTKARTMRTVRQLLGPWRKSEEIVPTTFRQPKAPDSRTLVIAGPTESAELRLALRGLSRADSDASVATILARVAQYRWADLFPEIARKPSFVRSDTYVLPGQIVMGTAVESQKIPDAIAAAHKALDSLLTTPPTTTEIDRAQKEVVAEMPVARPDNIADAWLDMHTYRLAAPRDAVAALQKVSPADVQRVAVKLFKDAAIATVVVGDPLELKAALQGRVQFEVLGEVSNPAPSQSTPKKPGIGSTPG